MSAILAVCGTALCAMVSDGRMVEEPITDGKIKVLTDALPKVRKLNRNVLVGFAGDAVAAAQIINKLDEYDVQYMTLEKAVKGIAAGSPANALCPSWGVAAGGRPRPQGGFPAGDAGQHGGLCPADPASQGRRLSDRRRLFPYEVAPYLEQYVKPEAARWHTLDDIAKTLDGCIAKLAEADQTVNTKYFRELVM